MCQHDCPGDAACPADKPVCNLAGPLTGECTQCAERNTDLCVTPDPLCDLSTGTCVQCVTSDDCTATPGTPICSAGQCVGCTTDTQCTNPALPACEPSGVCGQCSATNDSACVDGTPVCNAASGTCVECNVGTDCTSGVCNTAAHTCGVASAPDAPPAPDAKPPAPDAPTAPDAKLSLDAVPGVPDARPGVPIEPDRGVVEGGGLSCSVGGHDAPAGAAWTLLIGLGVLLGRRRRNR